MATATLTLAVLTLLLFVDALVRHPGSFDYRMLNAIQAIDVPGLEPVLRTVSRFTSSPWAIYMWIAVFIALLSAKWWATAGAVLLVPAGVGINNIVVSGMMIQQPRPEADHLHRLVGETSATSFPSGHVVGAVLLYGIVFVAARRLRQPGPRLLVEVVAVAVVAIVGLARLWMGTHWVTDVLAAYTFGGALLLPLIVMEREWAKNLNGLPLSDAITTVRRLVHDYEAQAETWIRDGITTWREEGRLSAADAARLEGELNLAEVRAIMPHLAAHVAIGVALPFPISSAVRIGYTLSNLAVSTGRFVAGRVDRRRWRRDLSIHSPIIMVVAIPPIIGELSYLVSGPIRSHRLLVRVALDRALVKTPGRLYQRTGMRSAIVPALPVHVPHRSIEVPLFANRDRPVRALMLTAAGLLALDVGSEVIDDLLHPSWLVWTPAKRILDLNAEASFGSWFSVAALFTCALLLSVIAWAARQNGDRFARHWWGLALIALALSVDEQAEVHDPGIGTQLRDRLSLNGVFYFGWVIFGLVSVLVVALIYRRFILALPPDIRFRFAVAAALYVGGELGFEMINGWWADRAGRTNLTYDLLTSAEEFLSMLGIVVAISALIAYLGSHVGTVRFPAGVGLAPPPEAERADHDAAARAPESAAAGPVGAIRDDGWAAVRPAPRVTNGRAQARKGF